MENNNMTAVEWLREKFEKYGSPSVLELDWETFDRLINEAKEAEEMQIREAWTDGNMLGKNGFALVDYSNSKEYYNKTYGKE